MDDKTMSAGLGAERWPIIFLRQQPTKMMPSRVKALAQRRRFQLRVLADTAQGILGVDPHGNVCYANPAALALWKGPAAALYGKPLQAVIEGLEDADSRLRCHDGSTLFLECHQRPLTAAGKQVGQVISFCDVTRRKRQEEELRRSRRLLADAEALARVGSWEWTLNSPTIYWSDQLYRIVGVKPGSVRPTLEAYFATIHPDDRRLTQDVVLGAVRSGQPFSFRHRVVRTDGDVRWVHCRGEAVRGPRGEVVSLVGISQDVTEEVAAAEALRREEERVRQLELMRRSDNLKDQLIDTLSHELRTPISVIAGFTSILQEGLAGPLSDEQTDYLGQIQVEADHLLELINGMLELGQLQAGKLVIAPRPMHLAEVVKDVLNQLSPLAAERQQQLVDEVPIDLPSLLADDTRIAQVLNHLLRNAIKFSPEGSTVVVRARVEGQELRCEIEDGAARIPEEQLPRLFQRFTQLDMSTTRRYGGVGIGLFVSKALVEAHHGRIGMLRASGRGNTFWFTLPLTP